jgi:hypothetical protein
MTKKKIIRPLSPDQAPAQPDLNELLAREGMPALAAAGQQPQPQQQQPQPAAPAATPPVVAEGHPGTMPHPPGHVISPNPTDAAGKPIDPNSIAL